MSANEFTGSRDSSAHEQLVWDYIESLPTSEIDNIIGRAERKVEKIAYGMLMAGRPLDLKIRKRLIQSAIQRELNIRAG
ncbi:hypothetical protein KRR55_16420 [Paeniglutamicibacter sp. ABSL32-1]|uniref:hypothetical protein n=1 Tax=Paeniglutamicibacter quisquiliarum TaxID=2849498 RepID=UPI001C2D2A87|nr:hypothetical protein [Paeniglutamicibacter quisquiliarum]MBV1780701.1 hypothetical protein [Paeniglutamicibacter quisquiliarum]